VFDAHQSKCSRAHFRAGAHVKIYPQECPSGSDLLLLSLCEFSKKQSVGIFLKKNNDHAQALTDSPKLSRLCNTMIHINKK
jgi:hypothetical protein